MNIGVHTSHCCARHGCKYSNDECPVVLGTHKQAYPCEFCGEEAIQLEHDAQYFATHPDRFIELLQAINMAPEIEEGIHRVIKDALKQFGIDTSETELTGAKNV